MFRRSPDFWSGLALIALGVYIVTATRGWDYLSPEGPGPAFFPRWYGVAMIVLAAALMIANTRATVDWRGVARALGAWAAIAVAVVLMKLLGFATGFALLTYFIVAVMYRRRQLRSALVAAGMVAAFYLIFALALGVPLP